MNDNFIFGTLNHVCTKEKFDSMYGWYGSNGHYMWKIANFGDFWWFFGPLEPRWDPISFTRRPMNDYFIFGTLNLVCTNEKFDSMYGWYGSNAQNMWKIANFGRFLMIFGPFGARYHPLYYTRNPMIDCFTVGTFHNVYSKEKSDSLYGYYGCNGKNVLKNRSFFVIFEIFGA